MRVQKQGEEPSEENYGKFFYTLFMTFNSIIDPNYIESFVSYDFFNASQA